MSYTRKEWVKNLEEYTMSYTTNESPSEILKIENLSKNFHPDDLLPLYQNNGKGLKIPPNNLKLKKLARSQSIQTIQKVKDYCENAMPHNYYLRLANEHVENTNKFLYYDFFYRFLYCQTQKVINYFI